MFTALIRKKRWRPVASPAPAAVVWAGVRVSERRLPSTTKVVLWRPNRGVWRDPNGVSAVVIRK